MKKTLNLKHPIMIDNKEVSALDYDVEEITAALYSEADTKRRIAAGVRNVTATPSAEIEFGLHAYVGMAAVIAVNPGYSFEDLERVKGTDMLDLQDVGRRFLLRVEASGQNASGSASETTHKPTTQAPENSETDQ